MAHQKLVLLFLRLSIASVFLYAAIAATLDPNTWISFFPPFLISFIPAKILLPGFAVYQIGLSVWILSGWKSFWSAILAALTLIGIILSNLAALDIVFRDFAIFFAAIALAVGSYDNHHKK
ncbi:MAG TPA: hypothetical protein VE090_02240 [Methylomirabilota bacterium]|nr:hypothetical protein [Methylomirabilota bacterium]